VGLIEVDFGIRAFAAGQYVTTQDGLTGYIYEDHGGPEEDYPYRIAICEHAEERSVSASRMTLWVPEPGDTNLEPVWSD
jgi:hypothetical protein